PSPTGFLHMGGARTALFKWFYARHHQRYGEGGTFRLRIEDMDGVGLTPDAIAAIVDGLSWRGLDCDRDMVDQFGCAALHRVVVDDHDMGITHVIRGDDHLNNAFRQTQIYRALEWHVPEFAHVPLIHDASGAKMSKRRGTVAVDAYRDMGYLPEALRNYLVRL